MKDTVALVWMIISAVLAVVGGIALYFTFLKSSNESKFKGFWGWLYDFLSFKKMFLEALLRIQYLVLALFITLSAFAVINNFLIFLAVLVLGNLALRIIYEFSLVLLVICRNTTDISKKLGNSTKVEETVENK